MRRVQALDTFQIIASDTLQYEGVHYRDMIALVENQLADRYLYVPTGLIVAGLWYRALTKEEREENVPPKANA